jgi:drug/metabolite transporter (DMT)-like permease
MPLMASVIYDDGVNSITLAFLRNLLSLPVLAVLAFCSKGKVCLSARALPGMGFIALMGCCLTPLLLFSSYNYIQSGTATVFHFIYPAAVVLGEFIFLKSQKNRKHILCVLICMAGIALFYSPGHSLDPRGSLLALSSGMTYAIYVISLSTYKHEKGSVFGFRGGSRDGWLLLSLPTNQRTTKEKAITSNRSPCIHTTTPISICKAY